MTNTVAWDSRHWGRVFEHESADQFCSQSSFKDGVHQVRLDDGGVLEVLLRGQPTTSKTTIPVFYSGSVNRDNGAKGPFFSGVGVTKALKLPLVAISDPLLRLSSTLRIGWYTGALNDHARAAQVKILNHISDLAGQSLLLVGGSAGGFGILAVAGALNSARVFVWNPQTDLIRYIKAQVTEYLDVVLGDDWQGPLWPARAKDRLAKGGVTSDLRELPTFREGLIIQNDSDWHLRGHLGPYVIANDFREVETGVMAHGTRRAAVFNFGKGHATPSSDMVKLLVSHLIDPESTGETGVELLRDKQYFESRTNGVYPLDLRDQASEVESALNVKSAHTGVRVSAWTAPDIRLRWPSAIPTYDAYGPKQRIGALAADTDGNMSISTGQKDVHLKTAILDPLGSVLASQETQVPRPE